MVKKTRSTAEKWPKVTAAISTLSMVVVIGTAIYSAKSQWTIANQSGNFDKGEIVASIGGYPLQSNQPIHIILGADRVGDKNAIIIGAMPFEITSNGQKSLADTKVTFRYPAILQRKLIAETNDLDPVGDISSGEIKSSITHSESYDFESYSLPAINPGESDSINEPIFLDSTSIEQDIHAVTKDGVKIVAPIRIDLSALITFTVSAKDIQLQAYELSVAMVKSTSMQDMIKGPLLSYIEVKRKEIRKKLSFFQYTSLLLKHAEYGTVYLVFDKIRETNHNKDGRFIFQNDGEPTVVPISYSLCKLSLLFEP